MKKKTISRISLFLIPILLLIFIACSQQSTQPESSKKVEIPAWFLNAYEPEDGFIYGVGSSTNLARAKEKALREIAAKIEVSIKSKTETTTKKNNRETSQRFEERINSTVQEFTFSDAKTEKQVKIDGEYYVRMRVAIEAIIQNTTQEIEQLKSKLDYIYSQAEKKNKLERLFLLKINEEDLNKANILINRLNSLYQITPFQPVNSIPTQEYLDLFRQYQTGLTDLTFSIFINVIVNNEFKKYAFIVSNHLTEVGLKNEINSRNKAEAQLDISVQLEKTKLLNDFLVKAKIGLLLKDANHRTFQNKVLSVKSFSPLSHENALVGIENKLNKMIKKEGILQLLGIH